MRAYEFRRPSSLREAVRSGAAPDSAFIAGGTNLVDLMKLEVLTPRTVVDIDRLDLRGISVDRDGLRIGALERMSDVAEHPEVVERVPMVARALQLGASAQLRNMASIGGNLMQRTRCGYFRDLSTPCNKRNPGSGCAAIDGHNRFHAVLGTSDACVATHASDLCVALAAADARLRIEGPGGVRTVALNDFYALPGATPDVEHDLRRGEIITRVTLPVTGWLRRSTYVKVRDRASYEFALASAAVAVHQEGGRIVEARVAVGGVGTRPWRLPAVEAALAGRRATRSTYQAAAERAADGARPLSHNAYKIPLLRRTIVRALTEVESLR